MIRNINYHIIPECYLDTNLVETIVPPQKFKGSEGYNHQHTCNDVVKLIRTKLNDNFAVGIVTGITLEFQFGTNWSRYSAFVGDIFGSLLAIEATAAFFLMCMLTSSLNVEVA